MHVHALIVLVDRHLYHTTMAKGRRDLCETRKIWKKVQDTIVLGTPSSLSLMIANYRWINPCVRHALDVSKGGGRRSLLSRGQRGQRFGSTSPNPTPEPKTPSQQGPSPQTKVVDSGGTNQQQTASSTHKISWLRGYLGAHSNTDPPDAKFLAVAAIVLGAGFYAWFVEPPKRKEDS